MTNLLSKRESSSCSSPSSPTGAISSFYEVFPVVLHWLSNPALLPPDGNPLSSKLDEVTKKNKRTRKKISLYGSFIRRLIQRCWSFLVSPRVWFLSYLFLRWLINDFHRKRKVRNVQYGHASNLFLCVRSGLVGYNVER